MIDRLARPWCSECPLSVERGHSPIADNRRSKNENGGTMSAVFTVPLSKILSGCPLLAPTHRDCTRKTRAEERERDRLWNLGTRRPVNAECLGAGTIGDCIIFSAAMIIGSQEEKSAVPGLRCAATLVPKRQVAGGHTDSI